LIEAFLAGVVSKLLQVTYNFFLYSPPHFVA